MKVLRFLTCTLFGAAMAAGCGGGGGNPAPIVDQPYETCYSGDVCAQGLYCTQTLLPASSGYTGFFCTSGCTYDTDCVQLVQNYNAVCVSGQCYLSCPAGSSTCPYDQGCFTFNDNGLIDLCTP
jgi:hypothetical protein